MSYEIRHGLFMSCVKFWCRLVQCRACHALRLNCPTHASAHAYIYYKHMFVVFCTIRLGKCVSLSRYLDPTDFYHPHQAVQQIMRRSTLTLNPLAARSSADLTWLFNGAWDDMYISFRSPFSAVSTPIVGGHYSFRCIFRDLQNLHSFAPLQTLTHAKNRIN